MSDTPWVIEVPRNNHAAPQTRSSEDDDVVTDAENESFWDFEVPEDDPYVAVKLTYEYAVFKVESFEDLVPEQLMLAWQSFSSATDPTTSMAALIGLSGIVRVAAISTTLASFAVV
eukprot:scaffold190_cov112-Skeletonema_marinoi.AAC.3